MKFSLAPTAPGRDLGFVASSYHRGWKRVLTSIFDTTYPPRAKPLKPSLRDEFPLQKLFPVRPRTPTPQLMLRPLHFASNASLGLPPLGYHLCLLEGSKRLTTPVAELQAGRALR